MNAESNFGKLYGCSVVQVYEKFVINWPFEPNNMEITKIRPRKFLGRGRQHTPAYIPFDQDNLASALVEPVNSVLSSGDNGIPVSAAAGDAE